jgi:hypothetical protein
VKNAQVRRTESESLETRLRAYAVGAGAVATGLAAFSLPAAAEVVVTPAHVTLASGSASFPISFEGTAEFTLANSGGGFYKSWWDLVNVTPGSQAEMVIENHQLAALEAGAEIGSTQRFGARQGVLAFAWVFNEDSSGHTTSGPFANTTSRFLGLRFRLNGEVHYGWVALSKVTANWGEVVATITAYAYETEPNTPIYAGRKTEPPESLQLREGGMAPDTTELQPATLGVLALGSLGLDAWRKPETGVPEDLR